MKMQSLHDFFIHEIQDLYDAEKQITKALPKMIDAASNPELKEGFKLHLKQTEEQIKRLEQIQDDFGIERNGANCKAMAGLIQEGEELLKQDAEPEVKDAGLIVAAQKVEHYEIASYGSAIVHAQVMGHTKAEELLKQTLDEEEKTDKKLTTLAEGGINEKANET